MKKQNSCRLLVIVGIVMLIGLVASCGKDEPRFQVIESMSYTTATENSVYHTLTNKYLKEMQLLDDNLAKAVWTEKRSDVYALLDKEMQNKNPSFGLIVIVKADEYRMRCMCYWDGKPNYETYYTVWK